MTITQRNLLASLLILGVAACSSVGKNHPAVTTTSDFTIVPAINMQTPRSGHTATLLRNGRVLIAGGMERNGTYFNSVELYSPATGSFSFAHSMSARRVGHTATLLQNGKVLIAGGFDGSGSLDSAEVYDPATDSFTPTGNMNSRRGDFTSTLLPNGKVLVVGGEASSALASAEVYDPGTGKFSRTGDMSSGRTMHTATLLPSRKVLITGGGDYQKPLATAELYDPASGSFSTTGSMAIARYKHAAELLPDGNVLILGGSDGRDWRGQYVSAEIYDTAKHTFRLAGNMSTARFKITEAVARLKTGEILIAGGGERCEVYDNRTRSFKLVNGQMDTPRFYSTATLLADGQVLIAGGYDTHGVASSKAWLFKS